MLLAYMVYLDVGNSELIGEEKEGASDRKDGEETMPLEEFRAKKFNKLNARTRCMLLDGLYSELKNFANFPNSI